MFISQIMMLRKSIVTIKKCEDFPYLKIAIFFTNEYQCLDSKELFVPQTINSITKNFEIYLTEY